LVGFKLKKKIKLISPGLIAKKAAKGYRYLKALELAKLEKNRINKQEFAQNVIMFGGNTAAVQPEKKDKEEDNIEYREDDIRVEEQKIDLRTINIEYPLIPRKPVGKAFAYANIRWSKPDTALVYYVLEPKLNKPEIDLMKRIKKSLVEKLDVDFGMLRKEEASDYLVKKFTTTVNSMAQSLPEEKRKAIMYYIKRDFIGLSRIEPLMQDPDIEDISCDGIGIPIYIYHRNPVIGSIRTNVVFPTKNELDIFVNKLAQRSGKMVSVANPLVDASLPDGSRLQATLGTDVARKGSNFTIRKFTEKPLTPTQIMNFGTINSTLAAYLWVVIEYGRSLLISGGVATGKTSMLNAMSLFIKPDLKVVSIEDTPELRLPHPHWIPHVARQPIAEMSGKKIGEVDLFDLLRESLRQRPDYLIVGEVRGRETYVLFQQIATGHSSLSTIHADTIERLIDRLTTPPISLPSSLIESLDIIVFIKRLKIGSSYVRRVNSIQEIVGYDKQNEEPITNVVYKWNAATDKFEKQNDSDVLKRIAKQYGLHLKFLEKEIERRAKILDWAAERNIIDYVDFERIVRLYYNNPDDLLDSIM